MEESADNALRRRNDTNRLLPYKQEECLWKTNNQSMSRKVKKIRAAKIPLDLGERRVINFKSSFHRVMG